MNKVVINKEWAEAIRLSKESGVAFEYALRSFIDEEIYSMKNDLDYNKITLEEFSRAYLNGFEIEKSPQDLVEEKYNKMKEDMGSTVFLVTPSPINHAIGFMDGINYVNETLNLGLNLKQTIK